MMFKHKMHLQQELTKKGKNTKKKIFQKILKSKKVNPL